MNITIGSHSDAKTAQFDSKEEKLNIVYLNGNNVDSVICNISTPYPVTMATNYSVSIKSKGYVGKAIKS